MSYPPPIPPSPQDEPNYALRERGQVPYPQEQKQSGGLMGALGAIGLVIAKFFGPILKFLPLIAKSGLSMILTIGVYGALFGWKWGVGFVVLLLLHECGHLIAARHFGLPVSAPMFIPFMGAFIALKEAPRNAWIEAWIGIGGPLLGSASALACHALGEQLHSPLLISLAWTGYWLNLFNLIPIGQLDGGRIATALSPWLWVPGFAAMGYLAWQRPNFIIILVLVMAIPRLFSLFRRRTDEEQRFYEIAPSQRWTMGFMYFGLMGILALAMHFAELQLQTRHGIGHGQSVMQGVEDE